MASGLNNSTTGCHWLPVTGSLLRELSKCIKNGNMTLVAPTVWAHLHIIWHVAHVWPILTELPNVLDHTLICLWWHRGLSDTQTTVLSGHRKARPALLLVSPWGFMTQNKQKVCFLGLLKSCRHLVLYRGQIIYHSTLSLILVSPSSVASLF